MGALYTPFEQHLILINPKINEKKLDFTSKLFQIEKYVT